MEFGGVTDFIALFIGELFMIIILIKWLRR